MKYIAGHTPKSLVYESVEGGHELYRCCWCGAVWAAAWMGNTYIIEPVDEHTCPGCEGEAATQTAGISSPPSSGGMGLGSGGQQGPAPHVFCEG